MAVLFDIDHKPLIHFSATGEHAVLHAFILSACGSSLINVISASFCVSINELLMDDDMSTSGRQAAVFFSTLGVGIATTFVVYAIMFFVFGYGKSMTYS